MRLRFDGEDYEFAFEKVDLAQARYIKRQLGLTLGKVIEGLDELDPDALVALYWLTLAQNGRVTDIGKLNFTIGDIVNAFDNAEGKEEDPTTPA